MLILHSGGQDFPAPKLFNAALAKRFKNLSSSKMEFSYEYLELPKYSTNPKYKSELAKFLKEKYIYNKPDLIITYNDPAANFLLQYGEALFQNVPAILSLDEAEGITNSIIPANYKAVVGQYDIENAVRVIVNAQPNTKKIYIVIGDTDVERKRVAEFKHDLKSFEGKLEFIYLNKVPFREMLNTVRAINGDSVILYFAVWRDVDGNSFIPAEVMQAMYREAQVPIYGAFWNYVGLGSIGGYMISKEVQGERVADIGYDILQGKANDRQTLTEIFSADYFFDSRELKRWGIAESLLPKGSKIEYKQFDVWEEYRWQIICAIS